MQQHPLLQLILPVRVFDALERGTRQWVAECSCGHCRDLWETGAIRLMAAGEPRRLMKCPHCERVTVHRIRRKTRTELESEVNS